jgi:hypothetical protein
MSSEPMTCPLPAAADPVAEERKTAADAAGEAAGSILDPFG